MQEKVTIKRNVFGIFVFIITTILQNNYHGTNLHAVEIDPHCLEKVYSDQNLIVHNIEYWFTFLIALLYVYMLEMYSIYQI